MCKFTARKFLFPYIVSHIDCCTQISNLHTDTHSLTKQIKYSQTQTCTHIQKHICMYTHTLLTHWLFPKNMLKHMSSKWPFQRIRSNWTTNTYSQMLHSHLHLHISFTILNPDCAHECMNTSMLTSIWSWNICSQKKMHSYILPCTPIFYTNVLTLQ